MIRPNFVSEDDIIRWADMIDNDDTIPDEVKNTEVIREVCYSGFWLVEQLFDLDCPTSMVTRIQWTAGKLSFGKNPWDVHSKILQDYKDNSLILEEDPSGPSVLN